MTLLEESRSISVSRGDDEASRWLRTQLWSSLAPLARQKLLMDLATLKTKVEAAPVAAR